MSMTAQQAREMADTKQLSLDQYIEVIDEAIKRASNRGASACWPFDGLPATPPQDTKEQLEVYYTELGFGWDIPFTGGVRVSW